MKINDKQLKELRSCELYQSMLPRYQKSIEWIIKQYIECTEAENIKTKVYFVTEQKNDSIKIHSPLDVNIRWRRLLNLNEQNFEFGLQFMNDYFMPFFGEGEIALFCGSRPLDEIEEGSICLIKVGVMNQYFLVTKEETGFFDLHCEFFNDFDEEIKIVGVLTNIETK